MAEWLVNLNFIVAVLYYSKHELHKDNFNFYDLITI
jgi:hypothetical protein